MHFYIYRTAENAIRSRIVDQGAWAPEGKINVRAIDDRVEGCTHLPGLGSVGVSSPGSGGA